MFSIIKKGAMFGLDARIALAIFGALSVISGAALYSAIQESKAIALLADTREVAKAWEQFYLDTGAELNQVSTDSSSGSFHLLQTKDLVVKPSGLSNWNGPYLSNEVASTFYLDHPIYGSIRMAVFRDDTAWTDWANGKCVTSVSCSLWTYTSGFTSDSLAKSIDQRVDNGDGIVAGNFRWYCYPSGGNTFCDYFLKVAPYRNIHDT
tara:strand:+ start:1552 stop:2172 length:621 start_codon:yes stop_codon:yes gene_type:complete